MVPEGCPFDECLCSDPTQLDPWSARQMNLSPDGGATPAPRRRATSLAMNGAYDKGLVFRGAADIPFIDWRHYLEEELDMHNSSQSFVTRQRMVEEQGNHDNQVIWFTDARPAAQFDQTAMALEVLHDWITNIQADPAAGIGANRPAAAVDSCFATDGTLLALRPRRVGRRPRRRPGRRLHPGDADPLDQPAGGRRARSAASVFKCQTKTVARPWPTGSTAPGGPAGRRCAASSGSSPSGVCDYDRGDAGDPRTEVDPTPLERFVDRSYPTCWAGPPTDDERDLGLDSAGRGDRPRPTTSPSCWPGPTPASRW